MDPIQASRTVRNAARPAAFDVERQQPVATRTPEETDDMVASIAGWIGAALGSAGYIAGMAIRANQICKNVRPQTIENFLPTAAGIYSACLNGGAAAQQNGYSWVLESCQATSALQGGACGWDKVWNLAAGVPASCMESLAAVSQQASLTDDHQRARAQYGYIALVVVVAPVAFALAAPLGDAGSRIFRHLGCLCGAYSRNSAMSQPSTPAMRQRLLASPLSSSTCGAWV